MEHFCNWYPPGQGSVLQKVPQEASQAAWVCQFSATKPHHLASFEFIKEKARVIFFVYLFLFGGDEGRRRRFQAERH